MSQAAATELGARLLQATPQFTDEELCICVLAEARRYPGASRFSAYAASTFDASDLSPHHPPPRPTQTPVTMLTTIPLNFT